MKEKKQKQYAVGTDGCMIHVSTSVVEGWEQVKDIGLLSTYATKPLPECLQKGLRWTGARMPAQMLMDVLGTVHAFPDMETGFILYYSTEESKWHVQCPEQRGSAGSVQFSGHTPPPGYTELGTIHTHPNMGAFWSGTDLRDQEGRLGLHIVFGLHGGLADKYLCTLFTRNGRYDLDLDDVCEHVDRTVEYAPVAEWAETIARQIPQRLPSVGALHAGLSSQLQDTQGAGKSAAAEGSQADGLQTDPYRMEAFPFPYGAEPDADEAQRRRDEADLQTYRYLLESLLRGLDAVEVQDLIDRFGDNEMCVVPKDLTYETPDGAARILDPVLYTVEDYIDNMSDYTDGASEVQAALAGHGFLSAGMLDILSEDAADDEVLTETYTRGDIRAAVTGFVSEYIKRFGVPNGDD